MGEKFGGMDFYAYICPQILRSGQKDGRIGTEFLRSGQNDGRIWEDMAAEMLGNIGNIGLMD